MFFFGKSCLNNLPIWECVNLKTWKIVIGYWVLSIEYWVSDVCRMMSCKFSLITDKTFIKSTILCFTHFTVIFLSLFKTQLPWNCRFSMTWFFSGVECWFFAKDLLLVQYNWSTTCRLIKCILTMVVKIENAFFVSALFSNPFNRGWTINVHHKFE